MTDTEAQPAMMPINGRGRIPSWQGDEECDSVSFTEEMEGMFQQQLINIDEEMGIDDLHALKFLCVDYIPVSKLESATSPLDIFTHLRNGMIIDMQNVDFLLECLGRIHRFDLVKKLGFDPDQVKADIPNLQKVTPYRRLLMGLAEDMDDKDLQKMKFFLSGQIKKKKLNPVKSILDLFIVIEQEQITSPLKPGALVDIMSSIGRPDLVTVVNEFTGVAPARPDPVFTRVPGVNNQPTENPANVRLSPAGTLPASALHERELTVGSGISVGVRPPPVDRSASAGTLIVSESETSSYEDAVGGGGDLVPPILLGQVSDGVKHQFNDLGIELGFTNDEIEEYNGQYRDTREKTRQLLSAWQARKLDKRQIGPGLHYALGKLGQKAAADAIRQWMESRYQGNQPTASQNEGQRVSNNPSRAPMDPVQRASARPGFDINYTSSMNEARPQNFGFPEPGNAPADNPVVAGPPQNGYVPQAPSENICMSLREAQPQRDFEAIDPQVQAMNLQQIENQMRNINISGQLPPQQIINSYNRAMAQMDINNPQIQAGQILPVAPVNQAPVARAPPVARMNQDVAQVSNVDRDASDSLPEYNMNRQPRGWCVIINNREFKIDVGDKDAKEMPPRVGTDKDAESLQVVFGDLGFTVHRRDNLTDSEIMRYLIDVSHNVDHRLFDCLVVCILTHGVENYVYGSNGKLVSIKDITSTFQANRCPHLAGKPKLFFFQACQGRNKMEGNEIEKDAAPHGAYRAGVRTGNNVEIDGGKEMIPNEADFLIGYATVPGFVSFRSRNNGSWYIRKLCQLLEKYSTRHDLLSILVEVNREVSHANAQIDGGIFKQTPAPLVTLRKKLYFR